MLWPEIAVRFFIGLTNAGPYTLMRPEWEMEWTSLDAVHEYLQKTRIFYKIQRKIYGYLHPTILRPQGGNVHKAIHHAVGTDIIAHPYPTMIREGLTIQRPDYLGERHTGSRALYGEGSARLQGLRDGEHI